MCNKLDNESFFVIQRLNNAENNPLIKNQICQSPSMTNLDIKIFKNKIFQAYKYKCNKSKEQYFIALHKTIIFCEYDVEEKDQSEYIIENINQKKIIEKEAKKFVWVNRDSFTSKYLQSDTFFIKINSISKWFKNKIAYSNIIFALILSYILFILTPFLAMLLIVYNIFAYPSFLDISAIIGDTISMYGQVLFSFINVYYG